MATAQPRFYPGAGAFHGKTVHFTGYAPSKEGIQRCALGPEIHHALSDLVEHALVFAELIAPNDTSQYQASFFSEVIEVADIPFRIRGERMPRWSGRVGNSSEHAILVEVGAGHTPAYRVMGRTLDWIETVSRD